MASEEQQTFDVRLSLNVAVLTDAGPSSLNGSESFQRRRVKGCPALQTKAYKNLLGGGKQYMTMGMQLRGINGGLGVLQIFVFPVIGIVL